MAQRDTTTQVDDATEYYAILNISRDAPDEDVRRAYRNLAQVYHPDKHTDPEQKERAQEAFGKLQEAYEVLSEPNRRQVYDVYGKEGLAAGFELSTKLDSVEEMKKKWEEFQKKQAAERNEQLSNHRGSYMCRVDASDLRASLLGGTKPLFRAVSITNSIDTPLGDGGDVIYLQGQAMMRNNAGAGNLIFGYRRVLSPHDTLDGNVVLGLRSALTLQSTRQVTPYTTASLTTSYAVGSGVGMQLSSTRHLPYNMQATLAWVVGPAQASGLTFSLTKKGTKYLVIGKLELGAVTAVSLRFSYHVTSSAHLRAIVRAGSTGVDLELGAGRKWGASTTGYMAAVVGLQGVAFKGRLVRGGQTFEVPVVVSTSLSDMPALAAVYVLPPLTYVLVTRCVVRPLVRWQRQRKEAREQQERTDATRGSLQKASAEHSLIEPVARRKARSEAARRPAAGLVILDAVYGSTELYLQEGGTQHRAIAAAAAAAAAAEEAGEAGVPPLVAAAAAGTAAASSAAGGRPPRDGSGEASASGRNAGAAAAAGSAADGVQAVPAAVPPPPWLSVTAALQYQVTDSRLVLYPGVPKKNQMGFADPTPGATTVRRLYVAYLHGSLVYEVTVDDTDGLTLPGAGEVVWDAARRQGLLQLGAAALGVPELLQPPLPQAQSGVGSGSGTTTPGPSPRVR